MSKEFLMLPPVEQLIGGFVQQTEEWKTVLPLLRTTVLDDISHIVIRYVTKIVDAPSFALFTDQEGKLRVWSRSRSDVELDQHDLTIAQWAYIHGEMAGAGTQTLADGRVCFIPMKTGDSVVGVIGVQYDFKNLLVDQRRLLNAVAGLSALGAMRWVNV
jgi:two-component system, OmpR family, sensor histidine kinase KdpD